MGAAPGEPMAGGYAPPSAGDATTTGGLDPNQNILSIIGIVTGVMGAFCCLLFSVIGLVLGVIAYSRKEPLAIWAIIAGGAGLAISILMTVVFSGPSLFF